MGQTADRSDFLDLDSDPEASTRLVDPVNAREGIYSSENSDEEENISHRDEYISLPARKWEIKNHSLANSTLQLALVEKPYQQFSYVKSPKIGISTNFHGIKGQ